MTLLWIIRPYLTGADLKNELDGMIGRIAENKELPAEDAVALAAIVSIIDRRKSVMTKALTKRIHKIYLQHASELYKLLPPDKRKTGFKPPGGK